MAGAIDHDSGGLVALVGERIGGAACFRERGQCVANSAAHLVKHRGELGREHAARRDHVARATSSEIGWANWRGGGEATD